MSSNLRETAVCQERYRKGGMRTTLKTIRIWTWSTLTSTRTKTLTGSRLRKKVVMCMLLLTLLQSNHLVSMIKLQWAHASIISQFDPVLKAICARAAAGYIKSHHRRGGARMLAGRKWLLACSCSSWWSYPQRNAVGEQVPICLMLVHWSWY